MDNHRHNMHFLVKIKQMDVSVMNQVLFLGWYACEEDISKEIMEIHDAMVSGIATYTLKYNVRTKKSLLGLKIEAE